VVPGLLFALLLTLAGCGSSSAGHDEKAEGPSKDALACRAKWKDLASKVDGRDSKTNPSSLAPRWNNVTATVDYYATSAAVDDCGTTIDGQEKAMDALTSFGTRLAPYDMELRLEQVKADAQAYATGRRPPAPKPSPAHKGKKQKKPAPRAPKPADIAAALKTLTQQAPLATVQQGPAWEQARVTELGDTAAVNKTVKDLAFLSGESKAYRACSAALAQIRTARRATGS